MISLENLSLNLEKSNIKDSNYNVVEEGLSNLVNLTRLELIVRNSKLGERTTIGGGIMNLSNLVNLHIQME